MSDTIEISIAERAVLEAVRAKEAAAIAAVRAKEAAAAEKAKKAADEKTERAEENDSISRWNNFVKAEKVLNETDMKFYRDGQPKYFRKLTTSATSKKTGVSSTATEIKFYSPGVLGECWIHLKDQRSRDMFRTMVEGGEITVQNPETGEWVTKNYPPRVYDKLTNTLSEVDDKTYNLLELNDRVMPNYGADDKPECPLILKALLCALSGNEITWNEETQEWDISKKENLYWLEKWVYGTIYADIGNSMASFPVIFGPGKVGKNALFDIVMKQCLGKDACFSGTWDVIHGNFDGYKLGKVMMFIDEVPERSSWDELKNMTGSSDAFVKQKYGAEFSIENTIRYAVGTNEEVYPMPVENGPQMMRVSPIKTTRMSTFAENTVKMMDKQYGEGYCRQLLKDSDDTQDIVKMSDFEVGDKLLRVMLNKDWASREAAQQVINYLDYTYKSSTGLYSLSPLRGADWEEIIRDKMPSVQQVVDYIVNQEVETIATNEMYEIYKVIQSERSDSVKKMSSFSQAVVPLMKEAGFTQHQRAVLSNGVRTTIYTTGYDDSFTDYVMDIDKYIIEIQMGSNALGPKQRRLKYDNVINIGDILQQRMTHFKR